MKRLHRTGKAIVAIGVLCLVGIKVQGHNGFGGYFDNTWEIMALSGFIMLIGLSLIIIGKSKS